MDAQKTYDRIDREVYWQVLRCMMWVVICRMELRLCILIV